MNFRTMGLVVREQSISENDKLVTLLTKEKGIIRAFARGAKSPRSKKSSGTQQFCYCDFSIYCNQGNVFSVEEAIVQETFFDLRKNIKSLALAQYFCEIAVELCPREEDSESYLKLLLNSLYLLMNEKKEPKLLKPITELRLLSLSGYMPNVVACDCCGEFKTDVMYFDTKTGRLYCSKCNNDMYNYPLSLSAVTAMRHVCFSEIDKLFSFTLKEQSLDEFCEATERYLCNTTARYYKTLDFYKIVE